MIECYFANVKPKYIHIMANKKSGRVINVCVVGLSGYDITEKCLYGVGKSCFCNRLVRPKQDDYYPDHTSIFSTSDFVGSVINNDHFLYWGNIEKKIDDHTTVHFRVIEQTEFIDDASYMPLSKGGQIVPYNKRATATKLLSPGKIRYVSRVQVALQSDYEQIQMDRDGKIPVDGFICIYDVSTSLAERTTHADLQEDLLSQLLLNITKSRKPVIVVATKCDQSNEQLLQRAHQFAHHKKVLIPLVECSSDRYINIDVCFQALYQLIDTKSRYRVKLISYQEGLTNRTDNLVKLSEKYFSLVKSSATDTTLLMSWSDFKRLHENSEAFKEYVTECGIKEARIIFNQQAKKIKKHYEDKKLNEYLNKLPDALDELLPSLKSIEWKWENCQQAIKNHILFDKWFQILPNNLKWNMVEQLFSTADARLPFDVLQVERSRACFDRHIKKLRESARKIRMKNEFRKLLELTTAVQPGSNWLDVSHTISNEESYKYLDDHERKFIFETYLRDITLTAKLDFQELLFESANKFFKLSKDARPSVDEMRDIYAYLQDDSRYKNLEYVGNARDILLFNHIALMQSPNRCLSGPDKCMDRLMQQVVELTTRRTAHNPYENDLFRDADDEQINILVIGKDGLAQELEDKIKLESSSYDSLEYIVDGQIYDLNIKVYEHIRDGLGQVISDFKPQGYLAIYSKKDSLEYIHRQLQTIQQYDNIQQMSLPLTILLANEDGTSEHDIQKLRKEGQNLANTMECLFVDYPYTVSLLDDRIHESQVQDAIRGVVDVINKRVRPPSTPPGNTHPDADINILLCAMCGDEYPVELILGTMLQHHVVYSNPDQQDTIILETLLGGARKTISVTLGSYHRAYSQKNQLFHGFILVYSATRLASLETLRAYASTLACVPVQVLAITGSASGASVIFHEDTASFLVSDGSNTNKLTTKFQKQAGGFLNFFNSVHDKRFETELTLQGIKRRKQDPLPDIPGGNAPGDRIPNGSALGVMDASTPTVPPDSPYVEVALRHSYIMHIDSGEESMPPSPDNRRSRTLADNHSVSTADSHDDEINCIVEHDESGLYAKVNKKQKFTYIKKLEKPSSEEDDDDDFLWQENMAYDSTQNMNPPERVSVSSNLDSPKISDRPYATVPFLPKGHKSIVHDYDKFATMPESKKGGWSNEPMYATIGQVKSEITTCDKTYEPDSLSSISSKSKESTGSQSELRDLHLKTAVQIKSPLASPAATKPMWHLQDAQGNWVTKEKVEEPSKRHAPLASLDDDENEDVNELRQQLENILVTTPEQKKPLNKRNSKDIEKNRTSTGSLRKGRSESNFSTSSLDPKNTSFIKKIIRKVSPHPSPGNSDAETDLMEVPTTETPNTSKKHRNKSFRLRKHYLSAQTPVINVMNNDDAGIKERSNTMPTPDSPKHTPKFGSLDYRKQRTLFNKKQNQHHDLAEVILQVPSLDGDKYQTQTLDRKKSKKWQVSKPKVTKDDSFLPTTVAGMPGQEKEKKKKNLSMKFPKGSRPKKRPSDISRQALAWEQKKLKNEKFKNSSYFGKPLKEICLPNLLCPVFVDSVIKHVEAYGMETEGVYRVSGNKMNIDAVMEKFETNNQINLQELGVPVHAVTGALKHFFKLLPEPLIPFEYSSKINNVMILMNADERLKKLRALVNELPQPNLEIFKRFMCHLKSVTEYKQNKMDVRNLQTVLYPTLLRPNFDSLQNMSQNMNMGLFIQTCIEQSQHIFENVDHSQSVVVEDENNSQNESINTLQNNETSTDDMDGLESSPSLMESVLSEPGMENIVHTPKVEFRLKIDSSSNTNKRESFETAID